MSQTVTVLNNTASPTTSSAPASSSPPRNTLPQAADSTRQQDALRRHAQGRRKRLRACYSMIKDRCPAKARLAAIGLLLGLISLLIAIVNLAPSFGGLKYRDLAVKLTQESKVLDEWQANATFRAWCHDEQEAARTLTTACEDALSQPLSPPPHSNSSLVRRFITHTQLLRHSGGRFVHTSTRYFHALGRFIFTGLLGLCFWKYSRRPLSRTIRAMVRVGRERNILPIFLRREYRGSFYSLNAPPPRSPTSPPRSTAAISTCQASTSSTSLSSEQSVASELRWRDPHQKQYPVTRKPLPPAMEKYLAKVYNSDTCLENEESFVEIPTITNSRLRINKPWPNYLRLRSPKLRRTKGLGWIAPSFSNSVAQVLSDPDYKIKFA